MIFFANAQGNITRVIPDSVYQNSHRSSEVVLVAPFSRNVSVGVAFNLPNGMRTSLNFAQPNMGEIDLTDIMDGNGTGYNAWRCLLEQTVTEYAGEVGVQFFVYNGYNVNNNLNLEILATYQSTFNVIKGVSYIPPVVDEDSDVPIYNQIMAYLSVLQASEKTIISTEPAIADGIEYPVTIRPDRTAYVLIPYSAGGGGSGGGGSGGGESTSGGTAGVSYALSTDGTYAICTGIGTAIATDIVLANTYEGVPVTTIGEGAFNGSDITSITISDNITAIMDDAFANCARLLSINVTTGNTAYKSINGALYSEYETVLIKYPDGKSSSTLTLPSALTEIKPYAINDTSLILIDATACERVPTLGEYNFINRNSELKIKVPYGLYSTWVASVNWVNYSNIIISNGVDDNATPGLAYSITDGVATCTGIGTATASEIVVAFAYEGVPVVAIGANAFNNQPITSITIPSSVTTIGENAFHYCESLSTVYYSGTLEDWCKINFDTPYSSPATYADNLYLAGELLTGELIIPDTITAIKNFAFIDCNSITSVVISNSVTSIGAYAFLDCDSLTSVVMGSSVTSIGERAFLNGAMFFDCRACERVPTLGERALSTDFPEGEESLIVVPDALYSDWVSDTNWAELADYIISASDYEAQ